MELQGVIAAILTERPEAGALEVRDAHGRVVDDIVPVGPSAIFQPTQADGVFFRDGLRWIRENGREQRLLDIAPTCERLWMQSRGLPVPDNG